jgi:hypothetical protein
MGVEERVQELQEEAKQHDVQTLFDKIDEGYDFTTEFNMRKQGESWKVAVNFGSSRHSLESDTIKDCLVTIYALQNAGLIALET